MNNSEALRGGSLPPVSSPCSGPRLLRKHTLRTVFRHPPQRGTPPATPPASTAMPCSQAGTAPYRWRCRLLPILVLCLVVSCATTPRAVKDEPPESRLPPGAMIYGFADVAQMKTAIEDIAPALLKDKNTAR